MNPKANPTPLDVQVGGDHYKKLKIQPMEYNHANGIPFAEGSVIKYVTRWRDKGGIKDLEKAKHFIEMLIELEQKANPAIVVTKVAPSVVTPPRYFPPTPQA